MEAMTVTARSITNNLFFDKIKQRELTRHNEKLNQIMALRNQKLKTMEVESEKISGVLKKAKEAAKTFEIKERDIIRKKENKILLEKLWKISQGRQPIIPNLTEQEPVLKHINHRAEYQRRVSQKIEEQNKYLARNLIEQTRNKRSKTQIKTQIKEYLALRDSIRKKRLPEQLSKSKSVRKLPKKSQSQRKNRYSQLEPGKVPESSQKP